MSDGLGLSSHPLPALQRRNPDHDLGHFRDIVSERDIAAVVVGLPLNMDGSEGEMAAEARKFGAWLGEALGLPIRYEDERLTTDEAETFLQQTGMRPSDRRKLRDSVAAAILLRGVLENERGG